MTMSDTTEAASVEADELRAWMADIRDDFARNGLSDSQHLRECRAQEQALCVQIALLQPQRTEQRQQEAA